MAFNFFTGAPASTSLPLLHLRHRPVLLLLLLRIIILVKAACGSLGQVTNKLAGYQVAKIEWPSSSTLFPHERRSPQNPTTCHPPNLLAFGQFKLHGDL